MHRQILFRLLAVFFFLAAALNLSAQGTAICYQGRLNVSGTPASASYDFRLAVYDAVTNGNRISVWLTNAAVPVASGLFTVKLDFGPGVFNGTDNGSNYWMDLGVRAIGVTNFTVLAPRQPVLPVPYAIFATSASNLLGSLQATQLVGKVPAALVSGNFPGSVNFSNAANNFTGTFSGNGAGLTGLNGSYVSQGTVADARLSGNVALLNASQTFSGANTFAGPGTYSGANTFSGGGTYSGVNTFSNGANYFQGNFFGNGLVGWNVVSGTAITAARDHGYLLQSASLTTVTLPAAATLSVGDIVRIAGAGAGGWLVKENAGQYITGSFASYRNGYLLGLPATGLPTHSDCRGVAATADGNYLYAVGNFAGVYESADFGQAWSQISSLAGSWFSIACSANGKIVYAAPSSGSTIQKSTSGAVIWSATASSGSSVACTADGSQFFTGNVACSGNGSYLAKLAGGVITFSINGGSTWNNLAVAPAAGVTCLGASSDCTRLVAGVSGGLLYATANQGQSWTAITTTNQYWSGAWMSADGSKFAATTSYNASTDGSVFYSSNNPQPNTSTTTSTGSLCGSQGSAVELQYVGSGQFMPVSASGLIWAN